MKLEPVANCDEELMTLLERAWEVSRSLHGNRLSVHTPGMFVVNGKRGGYRAISITGDKCDLNCEHCKGKLLHSMAHAIEPDQLLRQAEAAVARGDHGMLVSGGSDSSGRLPWKEFIPAIAEIKQRTNLKVTVHAGQIDLETARDLKQAGVDQALVDVMGDEETAREIYHLPEGLSSIRRTLDSLGSAELEIVPHILFGLYHGRAKGEWAALEMLKQYPIRKYAVVVIMPFRGTPMEGTEPPPVLDVASFIAQARLELPKLQASLGCARPRGRYRKELDVLAIRAGINSLALPSNAALDEARSRGLEIVFEETCCSLG
jgi:lipoyl synthase